MCVSVPSTSDRDEWTGPLQELSDLARPDVGAAVDLVQRGAVRGPVEHAPQWPARGSGGLVHGVQVERKALSLLASADVERVEQAVGRAPLALEDGPGSSPSSHRSQSFIRNGVTGADATPAIHV